MASKTAQDESDLVALLTSATDLDRLDDQLDLLARNGNKRAMVSAFGNLLRGVLARNGYDDPIEAIAHKLAKDIPGWQKPERTLPYHPLLVRSWLADPELRFERGTVKYHKLPEFKAWEAIQHHLQNAMPPESDDATLLEAMDSLYIAASANYLLETRAATKQIIGELGLSHTTELAVTIASLGERANFQRLINVLNGKEPASLDATKVILAAIGQMYETGGIQSRDGLEALELSLAHQLQDAGQKKSRADMPYESELQKTVQLMVWQLRAQNETTNNELAQQLQLSPPAFSMKLKGKKRFLLRELCQLDSAIQGTQVADAPSLTELYFHQQHQTALQHFEAESEKPFGQKLRALRMHIGWSLEQLGQAMCPNVVRPVINQWENEKPMTTSATPVCPDQAQLEELIRVIRKEEARLSISHGESFNPLLSSQHEATLKSAWEKVYDPSSYRRVRRPGSQVIEPAEHIPSRHASNSKVNEGRT